MIQTCICKFKIYSHKVTSEQRKLHIYTLFICIND